MKRTLLLFIFIISFHNVIDAQWYYRSCGVTDINNTTYDEFECLWVHSTRTILAGAIATAIGTSCMIVGFYIILYENIDNPFLFFTGFITTFFVGIPIWITGAVRKSQLRKTPNYNLLNLGSLNLSPVIGLNKFNGSHYLGMSLSLNF